MELLLMIAIVAFILVVTIDAVQQRRNNLPKNR